MADRPMNAWQATSAWNVAAARAGSRPGDAGVRLEPIEPVRLTTIIACAGQEEALARLVRQHLGSDLPRQCETSFGADNDIVWSAPGQWLVVGSRDGGADLVTVLAGAAAVTDQGDSRALVRVSGPDARDALSKGFAIDLHPTVFAEGSAAVTRVAHISVQIWQVDAAPSYIIAVPRSYAASFWSWLVTASAAFGYEVNPDAPYKARWQ